MKMPTNLFTTLEEARNWVLENRGIGCTCPCCGQLARLWKQPLHSGQAFWLLKLVFKYNETKNWVHVSSISGASGMRGGDYAKLMYWGLLIKKSETLPSTEKRASGYWKPSPLGISFVNGYERIPRTVFTYNKKIIGFGLDKIDIRQALGNKFNYEKLMIGA